MNNLKTKINEQNYPILREIYNIQQLQQDIDVEKHKHLEFLTLKHAGSHDFVESMRKNLTVMLYLSKKDLQVDYLVQKLFLKLDDDEKFRAKCFQQAYLIPNNITGCLLLPNAKTGTTKSIIYNTISAEDSQNGRKQIYLYFLVGNRIDGFEICEIDAENKIYTENEYNIYSLKSAPVLAMSYYIIAYLIFKHYATIESVEMKKGKNRTETKTLNNESFEVENRMLVPVTIIDSSWFRSIKGDGFTVSGHVRLQYYAKTNTHQFITIEPYQKTGYTRKAKGEDYQNKQSN